MQYKKETTKNKILDCALDEFYNYGEHNASIRRIAEKAGVAVGNIYNYFKSKHDIFEAIITPIANEFNVIFERALSLGLSFKGIEDFINKAVPFMVENKREIRLLMNVEKQGLHKIKEDFYLRFSEKIKMELDKIRKHYGKQPLSKEYSNALSKSFLNGAFELLFSSDDVRAVSAMLKDYFSFYFKGLESRI